MEHTPFLRIINYFPIDPLVLSRYRNYAHYTCRIDWQHHQQHGVGAVFILYSKQYLESHQNKAITACPAYKKNPIYTMRRRYTCTLYIDRRIYAEHKFPTAHCARKTFFFFRAYSSIKFNHISQTLIQQPHYVVNIKMNLNRIE